MPNIPATTPASRPEPCAGAFSLHTVQFHAKGGNRNDARAVCTCGWFAFGTLTEVQRQSAVHDLWEAVEVAPQAAAVPA